MKQYDNVDDYIADLKAGLARNPECGNTHYNLGVAYLSKRMFMEAEQEFRDAATHSPRMAEAWVQLGGIAMNRGDLDSCLQLNVEATKLRPFFSVPWGNIGFCQLQKGETDKAIKSLQKAIKYDPNFVQALATLGSAYIVIEDYEEAEKVLEKALSIEPNFGPAWNNMAIIHAGRANWTEAKDDLDKAEASGYEVAADLRAEIEANLG